jgi:hypothetical protein
MPALLLYVNKKLAICLQCAPGVVWWAAKEKDMSDRGSFVTEYIYCRKCFLAARRMLLKRYHPFVIEVPGVPIIAGRVSDLSPGGEGDEFFIGQGGIGDELSAKLCHPLHIAVVCECGIVRYIVINTKEKP